MKGPSEIDATLYAYLAIILNILPQNNPLKSHLNECPKLLKFVSSFQNQFLNDLKTENVDTDEEQQMTGTVMLEDEKTFNKVMPKILSFVIAIGAMSLFAIKQGIYKVCK